MKNPKLLIAFLGLACFTVPALAQEEAQPQEAQPQEKSAGELPPPPPQQHQRGASKEELQMMRQLFLMSDDQLARVHGALERIERMPAEQRKQMAERLEKAASDDPAVRQQFMQEMREAREKRLDEMLQRYYATLPEDQAKSESEAFSKMSREEKRDYIMKVREKLGIQNRPMRPRDGQRDSDAQDRPQRGPGGPVQHGRPGERSDRGPGEGPDRAHGDHPDRGHGDRPDRGHHEGADDAQPSAPETEEAQQVQTQAYFPPVTEAQETEKERPGRDSEPQKTDRPGPKGPREGTQPGKGSQGPKGPREGVQPGKDAQGPQGPKGPRDGTQPGKDRQGDGPQKMPPPKRDGDREGPGGPGGPGQQGGPGSHGGPGQQGGPGHGSPDKAGPENSPDKDKPQRV